MKRLNPTGSFRLEQTQAQQNTTNKKTASTTRKSFGHVRPSFEGAKLNSQPIAQTDKSAISPKLYRQKTEAKVQRKLQSPEQ